MMNTYLNWADKVNGKIKDIIDGFFRFAWKTIKNDFNFVCSLFPEKEDRYIRSDVRPFWLSEDHWIPIDEFDPTLNMDIDRMMKMDKKQQEEYLNILMWRRRKAHEEDRY